MTTVETAFPKGVGGYLPDGERDPDNPPDLVIRFSHDHDRGETPNYPESEEHWAMLAKILVAFLRTHLPGGLVNALRNELR